MTLQTAPPYPVRAVANYFLAKGRRNGVSIDPMKLQKLIYFAHGWHLAVRGTSLIDEPVEAWQYGPVIRTVYDDFKHFGRTAITEPAVEFDGRAFCAPQVPAADGETAALLDRVWDVYGAYTGIQLSNISHETGSPWEEAWKKAQVAGKRRGADIDDELIRRYFERQGLESRSARHAG